VTRFQPLYFVAESFRQAQERIRDFSSKMERPFSVRYNAFTQSIEVLDSRSKLLKYAASISSDLQQLVTALGKLAD